MDRKSSSNSKKDAQMPYTSPQKIMPLQSRVPEAARRNGRTHSPWRNGFSRVPEAARRNGRTHSPWRNGFSSAGGAPRPGSPPQFLRSPSLSPIKSPVLSGVLIRTEQQTSRKSCSAEVPKMNGEAVKTDSRHLGGVQFRPASLRAQMPKSYREAQPLRIARHDLVPHSPIAIRPVPPASHLLNQSDEQVEKFSVRKKPKLDHRSSLSHQGEDVCWTDYDAAVSRALENGNRSVVQTNGVVNAEQVNGDGDAGQMNGDGDAEQMNGESPGHGNE